MINQRNILKALLLYLIFVIYGSLVPFDFRPLPLSEAWSAFLNIRQLQLGIGSRADLIANFVLYIPLGFLAAAYFLDTAKTRLGFTLRWLVILGFCFAIAVAVEFTQIFFRPRTVSLNDLQSEFLGAFFGIIIWQVAREKVKNLSLNFQVGGSRAIQALLISYALAYFLISLFPFDFLISLSEIEWKLNSDLFHPLLSQASCSSAPKCAGKFSLEIISALPVGILLALLWRNRPSGHLYLIVLVGLAIGTVLEVLQFFIASGVSQGVSILTRALGITLGFALKTSFNFNHLLKLQRHPGLQVWTVFGTICYLALMAWLTWSDKGEWTGIEQGLARLSEISFLPFYYHYYTSEPVALANLLYYSALYFPLGILYWIRCLPTLQAFNSNRIKTAACWGGFFAFLIESGKLFLSNTHPDPTNILIGSVAAATGYTVTHWLTANARTSREQHFAPDAEKRSIRQQYSFKKTALTISLISSAVLLITITVGAALRLQVPFERAVDESILPQLPKPEDLPAALLPDFRFLHPRLPSPSFQDIRQLRRHNPSYLKQQQRWAKQGKGNLHSITLLAYVDPGSQDLNLLHDRLMALKFNFRGHNQVKPIAVAYDWLYDHWNDKQRIQLRTKLIEGCNYLIGIIRKQRLSPYNVYLYNSPFQALIGCSIALYGDDPQADPIMRFTHDLWKNRVLPVWQQIMGHNGGWHEGGEYVGIGIGQAIYQVPAMWRKATGEDLFASESGIGGFLDFLVYRTRPDDTHFRWGDAGHFNNAIPDRIPLAIEYDHQAAYSLDNQPRFGPTAWPWGPLPRPELYNPDASEQLPLSRFFDGLGLLVARSDWSPQATYVTFKAGDNYWSHSHLDQGAFTIYKGGALAIDSGLYGPKYNSDHHMNYTYQTIAHNTITVTDPDDRVPAPSNRGKSEKRYIANDGGQRRIGSGWGVEAAPLDLEEWEQKREIYHTGTMQKVMMEDGLVVGVADVTPAYTNAYSGKGTFSHRTRRVEQFRRTFGYDQVDDVVVIFDRVQITEPGFRVRWLLHTLEQPLITPDGFTVFVTGEAKRQGHAGGRLEAQVLLPRQTHITALGGEGFQFFVEDRNFDEDGEVERKALRKKDSEPGAWRVEVTPSVNALEHDFLVVLLPGLAGEKPQHTVRLLQKGEEIGCEIIGPQRITRWWFDPVTHGVRVEIAEGGSTRFYDVTADGSERKN